MTADGTARPDDVELFRMLARAMIELAAADRLESFALPYPSGVQRALDQVVLRCLNQGEAPPSGVPDLVRWCTERVCADWPFGLPAGFVGRGASLVDARARMTTRMCAEVASDGPAGVVEQQALALLANLETAAPSLTFFETCREFLIQRVLVTSAAAIRMRTVDPAAALAWRRVRHLYGPIPQVYVEDGEFFVCPICRLPARRLGQGDVWCEGELCPRDVALERHPAAGAQLLIPSLRRFLALPGRTERDVRARLGQLGADTALLEGTQGSLQLRLPGGRPWTLRVHDRVEPVLLAARVSAGPTSLAVVPEYVTRARSDYRNAFEQALPPGLQVSLVTDVELIAMASGAAAWPERKHDA